AGEAARRGAADGEGHRRHGACRVWPSDEAAADRHRQLMLLAALAAGVSAIGVVQAVAGWVLVRRHPLAPARSVRRPPGRSPGADRWPQAGEEQPAISVLKPLHGDEPLLEQALASICRQDYPAWQ